METIIPSLITGIVTALGSILGFIGTIHAQKQKALEAHTNAQKELQREIENKLDTHRHEYMEKIADVEHQVRLNLDNLTDMRAQTQQWQSNFEIKFTNLEEKVSKHNNFMEKLQTAQLDIEVLKNRESVSEHRLADLEKLNG